MIESTTDRDYFVASDDFGTTATFTSPALGAVSGIFDNDDTVMDEVNAVRAELSFTAESSSVPGVGEGSTLTINSTNYLVRYRLDDGTGITTLRLTNA